MCFSSVAPNQQPLEFSSRRGYGVYFATVPLVLGLLQNAPYIETPKLTTYLFKLSQAHAAFIYKPAGYG